MTAGASGARKRASVPDEPPRETRAGRSPLAQLLHALNQPLTGLQCSLEVTLASPRTNERYVKSLRDGLALTERMRTLVEAVREVVEIGETETPDTRSVLDIAEWRGILAEALEELKPVAEAKQVNISLTVPDSFSAPRSAAGVRRSPLAQGIFRLLESALALAARGTVLRIDAEQAAGDGGFCVQWETPAEESRSALSRPELGLLIAQAGLEHSGGLWERRTSGRRERLTLQLAGCGDGASKNA